MKDFDALDGNVAIVVEDAEVALTMSFQRGKLTVRDGIVGIPDVTVRGDADSVIGMSNVPLSRRLGIPWAYRSDPVAMESLKGFWNAMKTGRVHTHARLRAYPMFILRLTRVMSVHG
jgi:hypothetical protein